MVTSVSELKAQLSRLFDLVRHGESVTISRNNLPLVDLVSYANRPCISACGFGGTGEALVDR